MLPAVHRLRRTADFQRAIRSGRRASAQRLVVHAVQGAPGGPTRLGFVVSKAVGPAVVRNQVKRRLRHLMRDRVADLSPGRTYVVRANPAAATATAAELGGDLDRCLAKVEDGWQWGSAMRGRP